MAVPDPNLLAAIASSSATALVAITALIQNNRTVSRLEKHWDTRFDSLDHLGGIEHTRLVR